MNTEENNKMIAEFMGMKYSDKRSFNDGEWTHSIKSLSEFHTSWNWLMPVVKKCFKTGDDTHEWDNIMDTLFTCDRDIVYAQVVEFINQYNKNK